VFTLAHCSDWHATPPVASAPASLVGKRFFGWLSWQAKRSRAHLEEVLASLIADVRRVAPDHVAVTGDLTNTAQRHEFADALRWLRELGDPDWVSLVPGNHDAYVRVDPSWAWDLWAPYLVSDDGAARTPAARAPRREEFPTVRVRGDVALVGVCTALPTPVLRATGEVGAAQLERLERELGRLAEEGRMRVVLMHHPPTCTHVSPRRALRDAEALQQVLARAGAELVLHGHVHRSVQDRVAGPHGPVPVIGVPSASDAGERESHRSRYHLYRLEADGDPRRPRIEMEVRGFLRDEGRFEAEGSRLLTPGG